MDKPHQAGALPRFVGPDRPFLNHCHLSEHLSDWFGYPLL